MNTPDIKLFASCHKGGVYFPDNPLLYPIQVGAKGKCHLPGILHDDEGDNISEKNPYYCELTAQYWAWKNVQTDYYGFMHYRRYFSFADGHFSTNYFGDVCMDVNDEATLAKMSFNEASIRAKVEPYDFVAPEPGSFVDGQSMYEQYEDSWQHRKEDLDCVIEIIHERYPQFDEVAKRYLASKSGYFCNMFIMKRELFLGYCEWLFDILAEHERRRDFSDYDVASYRVSGYLAERLCGIYLTWLQEQGYSWTTLQRVLFADVDDVAKLDPVFEGDAVRAAFSANDFYVPYLSTLLESIRRVASPNRNYDLIILHSDISANNQRILKQQVEAENISLRFLLTKRAMRNFTAKLPVRGHFRVETYFRLLLPQLLPDYHKILYLDADMVVCRDIAELYDTDVSGKLIAACKDVDTAGLYNGAAPHKKYYMDEILRIERPYEYIQAGTILFNLDEWRASYTTDEIFKFAMSYDWELLDQDVINYLCQGRIAFAGLEWNVMMDWRGIRINRIISRAPRDMYFAYMAVRKNPAVIHFAGPDKPWDNPMSDYAQEFWLFARATPYYEEMVARMAAGRAMPRGKKPLATKAKELVLQGIIMPVVRVIDPKRGRRYEKMRYFYHTVHPRKSDVF